MSNTSDSLKKRFIAQISEPDPGYEMICLDENHYKMTSDYAEGESTSMIRTSWNSGLSKRKQMR